MKKELKDIGSERAILSLIFQFGKKGYAEVADLLDIETFTVDSNQLLFKCMEHALQNLEKLDITSIFSAAKDLGIYGIFNEKENIQYIRAISNFPIVFENGRDYAKRLVKLKIARQAQKQHKEAYEQLGEIKGNESIGHILSISESPILNFSHSLKQEKDTEPTKIFDSAIEHLEFLEENPSDIVGISTGFKRYDTVIGGGLRRGQVNLIASRPGQGKSTLAKQVCLNVAKHANIPCLLLDTEMSKDDQFYRSVASLTQTEINNIETGQFSQRKHLRNKIFNKIKEVQDIPFYYFPIQGKSFEEVLSLIRRWIFKNVGYDENGMTNNCLIVYDYFKLMDVDTLKNMQEYQALGFQITELVNFCQQYNCPCLSFVQVNRDGITKETTDIISQSDRLLWLASSLAVFKPKTDDEIIEDSEENGNMKLILLKTRSGPGLNVNNYINFQFDGEYSTVKELQTKSEMKDNVNIESISEEVPF